MCNSPARVSGASARGELASSVLSLRNALLAPARIMVNDASVQIIGRTGSLFTRVARIFADELSVAYELVLIEDLAAMDSRTYAGNPALRMPVLGDGDSVLFGTQNICRALAERAATPARIVWPEDLRDVLSRNAHELVWHGMAAQVQILMGTDIGELSPQNVFLAKARAGLEGALAWLDAHLTEVLDSMPEERRLSLFEVALYCLIDHVRFGRTVDVESHASLSAFARRFASRPSAQRTAFR
jgi:glutathione S-transferase